jgi:tRNA1(Val) A37 N6-methylase TrmN6
MHPDRIKEKFGAHYIADDMTYKMGIDIRLADHLANRFKNFIVLETCTGGGFSTISLAKYAKHVFTFEIDPLRMKDAEGNAKIAGIEDKITFINGDVRSIEFSKMTPEIDAAFIDPDWNVTGEDHIYRFSHSNTRPPSDKLLKQILSITPNVTLIQPPFIKPEEFDVLPPHECERLYMSDSHQLFGLHFGKMARFIGQSEFKV